MPGMPVRSNTPCSLAVLAAAVLATLLPTPWLALPGAVVLVLWLPGALVVRCLSGVNAEPGRFWVGLAASIVFVPVPLSWLWQSTNAPWAVRVLLAGLILILIIQAGLRPAPPAPPMFASRRARHVFAAILVWVGVCVFASYWVPGAFGRVATRAAEDYVKHHAVLFSLVHHPLPLHNPFYAAAADEPYYYYEYHYYLAAALCKLTGDRAAIGLTFGLTSALLAMTFLAIVYLLARRLLLRDGPALFAMGCVSIIGGWDAVPVLLRMLVGHSAPVIVLDSWASPPWRIHNLATQFLWCPQHVAALTALVLCALWLSANRAARWWLLVAPVAAASIFGSSVYAAMTMFPAAALCGLGGVLRARANLTRAGRMLGGLIAIGVAGALLMGLQAWHYHVMSVRLPGGLTMQWEHFRYALPGRLLPPGPLANYLDAWWIVLIDFGLPAVACVLVARRFWGHLWQDDGARLLIIAAILGTIALFTVRSTVNPGYDYSFRAAIMPANVVAALAAGALLAGEPLRRISERSRRAILAVGIVLGLPVGLYELPLMAVRTLVLPNPHAAEAGALRYLRDTAPADAVVQGAPTVRVDLLQVIERQLGVADPENPHVRVFMPSELERMRRDFVRAEGAFQTDDARLAAELLRGLGVTQVLVGTAEHALRADQSQFDDTRCFEQLYAEPGARVYRVIDAPAEPRQDSATARSARNAP